MLFQDPPLPGAYVIELEMIEDERGFFARSWCLSEFAAICQPTRAAGHLLDFVETTVFAIDRPPVVIPGRMLLTHTA